MKYPFKKEYRDNICEFIEVLKTENVDLSVFYRNLSKLKITEIEKKEVQFLGKYKPKTINIIINQKNVIELSDVFKHELLHLASHKKSGRNTHIGFYLINEEIFGNKNIIGYSINEGFTDLLCKEYFNSDVFYKVESEFAYKLVQIIGLKKMENYYFRGNLNGLIYDLSQYIETKDVFTFLEKLDKFTIFHRSLKDNQKNSYSDNFVLCSNILVKAYAAKLQQNKLLTTKEKHKLFNEYIDSYSNLENYNCKPSEETYFEGLKILDEKPKVKTIN